MVTLQGSVLIADVFAAILLIIALTGFIISRLRICFVGSIVALLLLVVTATILIETSMS